MKQDLKLDLPIASADSADIRLREVDRRPTVCHLLHSLNVGGAEVLVARIARRLSNRYRFVFACLDELGPLGEQLRDDGFVVDVLGRNSGLDLGCARRLSRFLRSHGVEVLHAHQYTPFFYALASRVFRSYPPVLFTEHGRWHPDYPRRKRIVFNRIFLRRHDHVIGVGEAVRQALINNEGISAERVKVIYNGVNSTEFVGGGRSDARRALGIGDRDDVVIQVARLDALKDHFTALRAIERLTAARPTLQLLLVGEGPERRAIEAEIDRRGLQNHVRLLGLRSDVAQLLTAADAFLLSSVSEGIPVTVIEAMLAELPVVSTRVGGVDEVVKSEVTGLMAAAGDDATLAEALDRLLSNESLRRQMGQAGRQRATELFSEQQMHESYAQLYREMLSVK